MKKVILVLLIVLMATIALCCNLNDISYKTVNTREVRYSSKSSKKMEITRLTTEKKDTLRNIHDYWLITEKRILAIASKPQKHSFTLKSDAGFDMELTYIDVNSDLLGRVYFADSNNGWLYGNGTIYRTFDGSQKWDKLDLKSYLVSVDISFFNSNIGYLVGQHSIEGEIRSEIWGTSDGGRSFNKVYENDSFKTPYSVLAVSTDVVLVALSEDTLLRTSNKGKNWEVVRNGNFHIDKLYKDRNGRVWAVGNSGYFHFSDDGGITWRRPDIFPKSLLSKNWNSISFFDNSSGVAVGDFGILATTEDGGLSWNEFDSGTNEELIDVQTIGDTGVIRGSESLYQIYFR